jgi:hypothetical protein
MNVNIAHCASAAVMALGISGTASANFIEGNSTGPLHSEPVGEEQYGRAYLRSGKEYAQADDE